ncbi:hypothetical protein RB614_19805 [Phytohabitans sp. ZYX-F-186]|uniref:Uncharacterized protein n=1 Tax=Phytohabitans maris TaxID=3071409 RepID=A0ABU0ZI81_9ACTN|nr:hypothetical protein [Phytohabitans sp. ZYX-F-186]MDQ7906765.1 hypothetical protein [Phytohabitans sp. ZYX-F-186]
MGHWAVVISDERHEAERLFHHDTLELTGVERPRPAPGDEVLVVAGQERPAVVALGRVRPVEPERDPDDPAPGDDEPLVVTYTRRVFDEPVPAERLALDRPVAPVDPETFQAIMGSLRPAVDRSTWMVSLALPIEAPSRAEAVRVFWSYVMELGPRELPAFVSPAGDELAMQAFVLGEAANLDPEEDED